MSAIPVTSCAGVGGIEAEAVMLGQPISMVLPQVIGYKLMGVPDKLITSTDIVLTITKVAGRVPCVGLCGGGVGAMISEYSFLF